MPPDGLDRLAGFDAIFLGAVGFPGVPDHVSLWGLLIPIRRRFRQYVNLRPVRVLAGMVSPLRDRGPEDIDFYVVRENNEGEYSEIGGRLYEGTDHELAMQESVFTRRGVDRILEYAFDLARSRAAKHLTSATKSNGIIHTMPYWDERFAAMGKRYPDVRRSQYHVDILAANFVLHPDWFDVVVGSNLFGDILSDLGPGDRGDDRHRSLREHQSGARASVDVRARARVRPRHRGAGHRQPDRADLVGCDDAGPPRPSAGGGRHRGRDRGGAGRGRTPGPRTSAGRREPPTSAAPSRKHSGDEDGGDDGAAPRVPRMIARLAAGSRPAPHPCDGGAVRPSRVSVSGPPARRPADGGSRRGGRGGLHGRLMSSSPRERYAAAIAGGRMRPDPDSRAPSTPSRPCTAPSASARAAALRPPCGTSAAAAALRRGARPLPVGRGRRGKTMLMDEFFAALDGPAKRVPTSIASCRASTRR